MTAREAGRAADALRPVHIELGVIENPLGSTTIRMGRTLVFCTVSLEEGVPGFLRGSGRGWVTAEYSMLPGSTSTRSEREAARGKQKGRTQEIQRLIGRALRAVVDLEALGERSLYVDCDVLQADGGTRTASITGAWVALADACRKLREAGYTRGEPVRDSVAAVSVGLVDGVALLDLCYSEDARATVDMNVVMTGSGRLVEVQGTGEESTFDRTELSRMLDLAEKGIRALGEAQRKALGG
jgi:ribonuclease PH